MIILDRVTIVSESTHNANFNRIDFLLAFEVSRYTRGGRGAQIRAARSGQKGDN